MARLIDGATHGAPGAWTERLLGEYREDPGLQLTFPQAARFFGLERGACARILADLVARGILRRTDGDEFVRAQPAP